jgi:hypothetical protein
MEKLVDLDECLVTALELFSRVKLPKIENKVTNSLIVGSGNAGAVGRLLFDGIHANESNYLKKLEGHKDIDSCVLISASGGKHSPEIARKVKKMGLKVTLFTNNSDSEAAKIADETLVFPKNIEPYTYNTSTYLGMILAKTGENPKKILDFIRSVEVPDLGEYESYYFVLPDRFEGLREFFETKFEELFGPKIDGKAFSFDQMKHAKTVVESETELFVGLGVENEVFGDNRLNFEIPDWASYGLVFALGYYFIGKVQKANEPWFKENIERYVKEASEMFGEEIKVIS